MTKALASIVLASVVSGSGNMASPQVTMPAPERKPLISGQVRLVSPLSYTLRQLPPDPVTGDVATYDFKPTVTTVDERAGIYDLSWIGYDQRVKSVRYQARDRLSVVVEAIVSRTSTDMIDYKYVVKSQLSSAQRLTVFTVQSLSPTAVGDKQEGLVVAWMGQYLREFSSGKWLAFAVISDAPLQVEPGMSRDFHVRATALPGLVGCRVAGGSAGMDGPDEEVPEVLMNLLPGHGVWPLGKTLGPDDSISKMSSQQRRTYWMERLGELEELGWMSPSSRSWFGRNLEKSSKAALVAETLRCRGRGEVTSEIVSIVESL